MRSLIAVVVAVAALGACKDAEQQAAELSERTYRDALAAGRAALEQQGYPEAVKQLRRASRERPGDAQTHVVLATALKLSGNEGAALLELKQAEALGLKDDPALLRERAEVYRSMGEVALAIVALAQLSAANQLTDAELLTLARLQAGSGQSAEGFKTLDKVQRRRPDDPDTKVLEAEILLLKGDEVLAAKLMDRLLTEHPGLTGALVLRARYFLANGYAEMALGDVGAIAGADAALPEVLELRARILNSLERYDETVKVLAPLVEQRPEEAALLALLAETELLRGDPEKASDLVDRALALRPKFPRAIYVRGRAQEAQGQLKEAAENYQYALSTDPALAPALSRLWGLQRERGELVEAMGALERLRSMGEATAEEKLSLAELYAQTGTNLDRAKKLADEALKLEPNSARVKALRLRLAKLTPAKGGVQILRGGR